MQARRTKYALLSPAIALIVVLLAVALSVTLGLSFSDTQTHPLGATAPQATLEHYRRLTSDAQLRTALRNTLLYAIGGVALQYSLGFGLALLLNRQIQGRRFFRRVFMLPLAMMPVVAASLGRIILDAAPGSPLAQPMGALIAIVLIDTWQWTPFVMLVMLAGLRAIPAEVDAAARMDGANAWARFRRITFPLLLPFSTTVILIRGLTLFRLFDTAQVVAGGGANLAGETLTMYIVRVALRFGNPGYAAALAVVLLAVSTVFAVAVILGARRLTAGAAAR